MTAYSYSCGDYPGMEECPGKVQAETEAELWQLIETHARVAHGEDPLAWSDDDKVQVQALIKAINSREKLTMAKTFMQMSEEAMARAQAISAEDTLQELKRDSNALLVDVRDESEVQGTGIGIGAINAPGRSIAWKADLEFDEQYREPELQNRSRRIITTCGSSPCYRGATAAILLTDMGFSNVSYVDGGMKALLAAGLPTK